MRLASAASFAPSASSSRRAALPLVFALVYLSLPCSAWHTGRATYYGGPSILGEKFDPYRGKGSFGILAYGSCGYTNGDGSLLFPETMYAASADTNADYPGSCGRCYEVKCVEGLVYERPGAPIDFVRDTWIGPSLPAIAPDLRDSQGRKWPGNPRLSQHQLYVKCWDPSHVIRVRIGDSCPCSQVLKEGAPGVKKGGEVREQKWCCGGEPHFDLSYYAFEQLAHPLYGTMMLQYRPVDCNSGSELALLPGFISKTIYHDVPQPGWGVVVDQAHSSKLSVPGSAPDGSSALCASLAPNGFLSFRCRECFKAGYQPFRGAKDLQFWVKASRLTGLKLFLLNEEAQQYCGSEVVLGRDVKAQQSKGGWSLMTVPFTLFKCGNGFTPDTQLDNLSFQNIAPGESEELCLADIKIL